MHTRMFMWTVARTLSKIDKIGKLVSEREDELSKQPTEFRDFIDETLKKITQIFSTITMSSITYGETAVGDIFLPSTVERLRSVMLKLASIMIQYPGLRVLEEKPSEERIKEAKMFFSEFGEKVLKNLPERLQSRKGIIKELIKHPEKKDLVYRLL